MKFACPKCRTPHVLADSELTVGLTFRFVCANCGHTIGVRRREDSQQPQPAIPAQPMPPGSGGGMAAHDPLMYAPAQHGHPRGHDLSQNEPHGSPAQAAERLVTATPPSAPMAPGAQHAPPASTPAPSTSLRGAPTAGVPHAPPPPAQPNHAMPMQGLPEAPGQHPSQHSHVPTRSHGAPPPPSASGPEQPHGAPVHHGVPTHAPVPSPHPADMHPAALGQHARSAPIQSASHAAPPAAQSPRPAMGQTVTGQTNVATTGARNAETAPLSPFDSHEESHHARPAAAKSKKHAKPPSDDDADDDDVELEDVHVREDDDADLYADIDDDDTDDAGYLGTDEEEPRYLNAAPGAATQLFMQTAGIYKRRKRQRIALWSSVGTLVAVVLILGLDAAGYVSIPFMGAIYDAAGMQDPDIHRAISRTQSQLSNTALSPSERNALRHKLLGLGADVAPTPTAPKGKKSTGNPVPVKKAGTPTPVTTEMYSKMDKDEHPAALGEEDSDGARTEGLSQDAIAQVVHDNSSALVQCMNEALRKGPVPQIKMQVRLVISPSGEVTDAQVQTERLKNTPMSRCTIRRVKGWKFPRFTGKAVTVVFPYMLSGGA